MITDKQRKAFLINIHRAIEEAITETLNKLETPQDLYLAYPPNGGLSEKEFEALEDLRLKSNLKSALRKILADTASYPIYHLFTLLDGVADPVNYDDFWPGFKLVPIGEFDEIDSSFLHDEFFETYSDWLNIRPDPGWKLDNIP